MNDLFRTKQKLRSFQTMEAATRHLTVVFSPDPSAVGRSWSIGPRSRLELGRGAGHEHKIADPLISSRHLRVEWRDGAPFIEDLGSGNGTFVDGTRLTTPRMLGAGSVACLGDTLLVVDEDPEPGSLPIAPDADEPELPALVGPSRSARALRRALATVAPLEGAALLLGPTGVGKEVSAQSIHQLSGRTGAFVAVNCAAIPAEIAEAELFGHTKGAFTGADSARDGYFVRASGGTLFLDEVGELPGPLQAKLLRVLEDHRVQPVGGGGRSVPVDVRIVAATNVDLWNSGFRSDLLARLADWVLHLPPLVGRRADILPLWRHFELRASGVQRAMTSEFAEALLLHDWPRNVRELRKLANGVSTLTRPDAGLDLPALPPPLQKPIRARFDRSSAPASPPRAAAPARDVGEYTPRTPARAREPVYAAPTPPADPIGGASGLDADEPSGPGGVGPGREALMALLRDARGNVKQVALDNGWHRNQLYRWLKRLNLDAGDFR